MEDLPVAAGDTVYVRQGTYRELLTVDISGSAGNPISYIADVSGAIFNDPFGGIVRITGSDNDQTATRAQCILASAARSYRTFRGFVLDGATSNPLAATSCDHWIVEKCFFGGDKAVLINGASQSTNTIRNCVFLGSSGQVITITHTVAVDNAGHVIESCIFFGTVSRAFNSDRVGGITIRNSIFLNCGNGVRVGTALTAAQTVTVNNCIFMFCSVAVQATATGEITENYNNFWANATDRTTVSAGANSIAYMVPLDPRWFLALTHAPDSAQLITPFDFASYNQLINVAGTSPATTDMRGTAVQGAQREWGPLEYDSRLKKKGNIMFPVGVV